jgi:protein-S-isoprenylcysteine O-methyltransferase Ste14
MDSYNSIDSYKTVVTGALIFLAFALCHSFMVMERTKRFFISLAGPDAVRVYYRLFFTIISALATAALVYSIARLPDKTLLVLPPAVKILFHAIQAVGIMFLALPLKHLDGLEFIGVRQVWRRLRGQASAGDIEGLRGEGFITAGVYGVVRHPLYLGGFLVLTFGTRITVNALVFAALADIYFVVGALIEERRMTARHGEAYKAYRREVPMFVPSVRGVLRMFR